MKNTQRIIEGFVASLFASSLLASPGAHGPNGEHLDGKAGASVGGWFQEMRSTALYWALSVPLAMLLFNQRRDLNLFLFLIIGLSVLGTLNGIKHTEP